jgi:hypothetical protein
MENPTAALELLANLVGDVIARVELLGLLHIDEQIADRFQDLLALHGELRARWPNAVAPPAATLEELRERVLSLEAPGRLRALAQVLREATLVAPDTRSERRWDKARRAAVDALCALADLASPPSLPGPTHEATAWFPWAWSQRSSPTWTLIEGTCPDLFDFLEVASPEGWFPESFHPDVAVVAATERSEPAPLDRYPDSAMVPSAVLLDSPRPAASIPAEGAARGFAVTRPPNAVPRAGPRKLAQLTDEELESLLVADTTAVMKNADRLLGPPSNRKRAARRQFEHSIRSEAKIELAKGKKMKSIPTAVPDTAPPIPPGHGERVSVASVTGGTPAPATPAEGSPPVTREPLPFVGASLPPTGVFPSTPTSEHTELHTSATAPSLERDPVRMA